jgi:hypothetical protein
MNIFKKMFNTPKDQPLPKVAMFLCIHNEERFLEANLQYHRSLGVSRAYVFLDRCEDTSLQIAQSFPWVEPVIVDDRLHTISPFYTDLFRVCADHAWRIAQAEGFDWLICFDADEFIFINHQSTIRDTDSDLTDIPLETILRVGHLPSMLATVSPKTEAIFLQSWNVVPEQLNQDAPFWKQQFFPSQKPWFPKQCDPLTGQIVDKAEKLASRGKSIVRTNADIQCRDSHQWVRSQGFNYSERPANIPIQTKKHGFLYHFYITDSHHWREKYQKLSRELAVWHPGNPVGFAKQCGKRASAVLTHEEIEIYLNEWVYLPQEELQSYVQQQLLRRADMVEKVITGVDVSDLEDDQRNRVEIDRILAEFRETERQIIASRSENKVSAPPKTKLTPKKSKISSGILPPVSCVCLPQGRPELLEEAIYSFLQQDYQGQKELVILNDKPNQLLEFDHPEIRIVNLSEQFFEPSQKRNAAIALCSHDLIFVWDDDGIYLPHCISFSIDKFGKRKGFFKPTKVFVWSDGALRVPRQNIFHSGICLTRKSFDKIRGYTFNEKLHFYKEEIEAQFERKYPSLVQFYDIAIEDIFYIYRWGGVKTFQNNDAAKPDEIKQGHIKLNPHWKADYPKLVRDYLTH